MQKFYLTITAFALSACLAPVPEDLPSMPDAATLRSAALNAYTHQWGRNPEGMTVSAPAARPILGSRPEWYACVTTIEVRQSSTYQGGVVIKPEGQRYKEKHVMVMRHYDDGWGAGIFRRVTPETKAGTVKAAALCPGSEL